MSDRLPGYRILEALGYGAHSKISAAVEMASGKRVAVKHVVRNSAEDDRFIEQVETEFAVGSQLEHPNLRRCFNIYRIRGLLQLKEIFLAMELVEGLTLDKARPNRLNTFLNLFQKVAAGLLAMHEKGWVHTDLKPINILLAQRGVVKVIDFGQACLVGTKKTRIQGTPDYIAPEQVRRLPIDVRTDVFNLGATMYWVLTSENYPTEIRGEDSRTGTKLTSSNRPLAPIEWNNKIPLALSNLVMECCRENPADRPADMKQIMSRLAMVQKLWQKHRESLKEQRPDNPPPADLAT